jgi:hypothetical protein
MCVYRVLRTLRRGLVPALVLVAPIQALAQDKPAVNVYGFGQADAIVDFDQTNPAWYDVLRPSRLPSFTNQYGRDGHFYLSPRQSRFGARGNFPEQDLKAQFEFDLFGVGSDAGLTTIRLRHAWGQYKQIGGGQTNSVFMDMDVFPNILDYWGPNGMLFFRNIQVFWQPLNDGSSRATIAIENSGASGDQGIYADRVELDGIVARFPAPDFTGEYRYGGGWGYVEGAGVLRFFKIDDMNDDGLDLSDDVMGWGLSLSSNIKFSRHVFRAQFIYGEGIQNYFNDAPIDVAAEPNGSPDHPQAVPLPIFGMSTYFDLNWSSKTSTAIGYSRVDVDNSAGQTDDAFATGQYASVNFLYMPVPRAMMGPELQWVRRENFRDDFSVDQVRVQIAFKYMFDVSLGG